MINANFPSLQKEIPVSPVPCVLQVSRNKTALSFFLATIIIPYKHTVLFLLKCGITNKIDDSIYLDSPTLTQFSDEGILSLMF